MNYAELRLENKIQHPWVMEYHYFDWLYNSTVLSFNMQIQTESNWCWAATSTSVSKFYSSLSPWTQCKVASDELSETCCTTPVPSVCNVPWYLDRALDRTNNFVNYQGGTISWSDIQNQLTNGLVVGARIGWNGGGGHFMVIHGVSKSQGVEYLHIDDPIYGKSTLTYNQFATNYQGSGTWTHTYFTKKYFYFMWIKDLVFNPKLLKPIPTVRPMLQVYDESIDLNKKISETDFGVPHYVFNLALSEIKRGLKLPQNPSSLRVLEMKMDKPVAFYEVGLDEEHPELIQMNTDQYFFQLFNQSISELKEADSKNKSKGELRIIRIPALNMEAVWLSYTGNAKGMINIIPRFDYEYARTNKIYSEDEFAKLLIKEASKLEKFDDTMGA